jgi:hypothetical protein
MNIFRTHRCSIAKYGRKILTERLLTAALLFDIIAFINMLCVYVLTGMGGWNSGLLVANILAMG